MKWLSSLRDAVMANLVVAGVAAVVGAVLSAVLGPLLFGQDYKERIAALEARLSQPTVINNVYVGSKNATELTGDVTEIRRLTLAEYNALPTKNDTTLYLIVE